MRGAVSLGLTKPHNVSHKLQKIKNVINTVRLTMSPGRFLEVSNPVSLLSAMNMTAYFTYRYSKLR